MLKHGDTQPGIERGNTNKLIEMLISKRIEGIEIKSIWCRSLVIKCDTKRDDSSVSKMSSRKMSGNKEKATKSVFTGKMLQQVT